MAKLIDKLRKYSKDQLIYSGNEYDKFKVERIPTGIFTLDMMTGGGVPVSRFTQFYGAKSSGKSTTALKVIGEFLKKYPNQQALYADYEGTYDPVWAAKFIHDLRRLHVGTFDYGEQGVDVLREAAVADDLGLIVVDSIAAMTPLGDATSDAITNSMGQQPKLVNKLFRKLAPIIISRRRTKNQLTAIFINQIASNFGAGKFQSSVITPGGRLKDFAYSLDLRFYFMKFKMRSDLPFQATHRFRVEKNKLGLKARTGEFILNLVDIDGTTPVGSFEEAPTVITYAKRCGLITKAGSSGWNLNGKIYRNLDALDEALADSKLMNSLKNATLEKCYKDVKLTITQKAGEGGEDKQQDTEEEAE